MDYPFMRTGSLWTIKLPITTVVGGGSNLYYISLWGHLKIQDIIGVLVCLLCMKLTLMKVMVFSSELFQSSLYVCAVWDGSWRDMNKWLLILDENWWQNLDINKVQFAEPVNFIGVTYRSEWGVTYRNRNDSMTAASWNSHLSMGWISASFKLLGLSESLSQQSFQSYMGREDLGASG